MIIDEMEEYALQKVGSAKVKDVRAGLGYTAILLDDGRCGLAYTFRNELGSGCGAVAEAGTLIGRDAAELFEWAKDQNRLKAAVGLASMNAVFNDAETKWDTGNVITAFSLAETETFGMVGEFKPILHHVKDMTKNIHVFEQNISAEGIYHPSEEIPEYLPKCDVVVVTATSIINHTIDGILSNCKNAREVCIVDNV